MQLIIIENIVSLNLLTISVILFSAGSSTESTKNDFSCVASSVQAVRYIHLLTLIFLTHMHACHCSMTYKCMC